MNVRTNRRDFLIAAAAVGAAALTAAPIPGQLRAAAAAPPATGPAGPFTLPPLGYKYDALEPAIDATTMQIHHDKHHGAYVANLNKLVPANPVLASTPLDKLLANDCALVPEAARTAFRNNGGGHYNHTLFWEILSPEKPAGPVGKLSEAITAAFESHDKFKAALTAAAMSRFGSGWAWLTVKDGKLAISSSANQDTPVSEGAYPILGIDVWEHAYYLKYQNVRPDYIDAFWNVVNWDKVAELYAAAS